MTDTTLPAKLPPHGNLPATYEAARRAIEECARIDEVKDWSDKAAALKAYAVMRDDNALRIYADRIHLRAERRCGELLKQIPAANGARTDLQPNTGTHTRSQAAKEAGLSKYQKDTSIRVANVPQDVFDAAVESDSPPPIGELAAMGTKPRAPTPEDVKLARAAQDLLRSFAAFCAAHDPVQVALAMSDPDMCRGNVEAIDAWLDRFVTNLRDEAVF